MKSISQRDKELYNLAYKIAGTSLCHYRMGAIITKGARVLSVGVNVLKTHPIIAEKYQEHCISIHAELQCLLRAQTDITNATMYVARNGGLVSKPCSACWEYMKTSGIKFVVYSTKQGLVKAYV